MHEAAGDVAAQLVALHEDVVGTAVLHGDAARDQAVRQIGLELLAQLVVPAERFKIGQVSLPRVSGT